MVSAMDPGTSISGLELGPLGYCVAFLALTTPLNECKLVNLMLEGAMDQQGEQILLIASAALCWIGAHFLPRTEHLHHTPDRQRKGIVFNVVK